MFPDTLLKDTLPVDELISTRRKRAENRKVLEIGMIADEYLIEAYGEDEVAQHMLLLAHIVSGKPNQLLFLMILTL